MTNIRYVFSLLSMLYDAFFVCDLTNGPFHQKLIWKKNRPCQNERAELLAIYTSTQPPDIRTSCHGLLFI